MKDRKSHVGRTPGEASQYLKGVKEKAEGERTHPEASFDSSDSSTADLDLQVVTGAQPPRHRDFGNRVKQQLTFTNFLKTFSAVGGITILVFFVSNIISLNRDVGRVEGVINNIPEQGKKIDLIYEKLGEVDKNVSELKITIEKNDEINDLKFKTLEKHLDSVESKIKDNT